MEAKIALFEEEGYSRQNLIAQLRKHGHAIIEAVSTPHEAIALIDRLKEGDIDVAMLDDSFLDHTISTSVFVPARIAKKHPNVHKIGRSASNSQFSGVDITIPKSDNQELFRYLERLPDKP